MSPSMYQWLQRQGLAVSIGVLVLGLLVVIGVQTRWGTSLRPTTAVVVTQASTSGETSLLPAFGLPAIDAGFKETIDRPLFVPSRRPVPVVIGAGQPVMKKGQFRLAGTVINNDLPYVFLVEIATGKGMRVAKGADIMSSGISVAEVDAARVVLKQGEETEELSLRTGASPTRLAAPAAPPGVAPTGAMQGPPPAGVVVSGVPTSPASPPVARATTPVGSAATGAPATVPQFGSSALPGFVRSTEAGAASAAPVSPGEAAVGTQRRRRPSNVPQQ
ncbi:MAG: hypothetical protein LH481_11475 [Burkholderiales bacterium]|nr:hypothetical protein [Burkholderiales bacterium]